jgi:hypothetical protein
MEPGRSWLYSQDLGTGLYPKATEFSQELHSAFI